MRLVIFLVATALGLRFNVDKDPLCVTQFFSKEALVSGSLELDKGQIKVDIYDQGKHENKYFSKSVSERTKFTFTTHESGEINFCFSGDQKTPVTLHVVIIRYLLIKGLWR
jgi:hypothetical protein